MKKLIVIAIAVGLIGALSLGAYAYYGPRGGMMSGSRGGMYGPGWMHDRDRGGRWDDDEFCPCGRYGDQNTTGPRWNAPDQSGTAPQIIAEDKAKEAAETFVAKYLPGYTVEKIEKDTWRPMYFVTLKGQNDAELQIVIRGFDGQVMHIFPKTAE